MSVQTISQTQVVSKTGVFPPIDQPDGRMCAGDDVELRDALKNAAREEFPPLCWEDTFWRKGAE